MSKKSQERLRWALRYIMCHPEMSPAILAEEWKIPIDTAIQMCSFNLATSVVGFGFGEGKKSFKNLEKDIFEKLIELK